MTLSELVLNCKSAPVPESKARAAKRALEALRAEIGSQPWIERAIISCDALDWGKSVDGNGHPIKTDGTPMTWKELRVTENV
jgi:hypothetical protein